MDWAQAMRMAYSLNAVKGRKYYVRGHPIRQTMLSGPRWGYAVYTTAR